MENCVEERARAFCSHTDLDSKSTLGHLGAWWPEAVQSSQATRTGSTAQFLVLWGVCCDQEGGL